MAKQYFIKSDNGEWLTLSGKEFYTFVRTEEGKSKHFMDFGDYMIEASKAEYTKWRKEKDHSDYINENPKGYKIISFYDDTVSKFGTVEDTVRAEQDDIDIVVFEKFRKAALRMALKELDETELLLIQALFLNDTTLKERQLAIEMNLSQKGVNKRKKKILEKLNLLVLKFEKSSQ